MPFADAASLVDRVFAEAFTPPERLDVAQWAERYRVVVGDTPHPGPWRHENMPHLVEPMRDFTDPGVREIVLMFSPQAGKTEFLMNCLMYVIDRQPGPIAYVLDSKEQAEGFISARLATQIAASPRVAARVSSALTREGGVFDGGARLWMLWSGSPGRLANKPIRYPMIDELDKMAAETRGRGRTEGSAVELAEARADAFGDTARTLKVSSPTDERTGIHAEFLRGDQAHRFYPCPHCGHWQRFVFDRVRWDGGAGGRLGDLELVEHVERVRRTAWYACAACGPLEGEDPSEESPAITNAHRWWMLQRGVWVRHGERVEGPADAPEVGGRRLETRVRSYHAWWLDTPAKRFGDVAAEFVKRRGNVDRGYVNRVLGEPWRVVGQATSESRLESIIERERERAARGEDGSSGASGGGYRRVASGGSVPGAVLLVFGGIDVQQDRVYAQVAGYGENYERYLLDYAEIPWPVTPGTEDLEHLTPGVVDAMEVNARELIAWCVEAWGPGGPGGGVDWGGIDSGDRTREVYALTAILNARLGGEAWVPTKGESSIGGGSGSGGGAMPLLYEWAAGVERRPENAQRRAAALRGRLGTRVLRLNTNELKDEVFRLMHVEPPLAGAWRWPTDVEPWYLRQLASEQKAAWRPPRGGPVRYTWQPKPGAAGRDNHFWDCTIIEHGVMRMRTRGVALTRENVLRRAEADAQREAETRPAGRGLRVGGLRR